MKQFKVIAECDDTIAIVRANNEEEAREKYDNGEIEEWEVEAEQPFIKVIEEMITNASPEPQHSREPNKVKLLAQYLNDYIEHEINTCHIDADVTAGHSLYNWDSWRELLEQALDAYQSTEQVKIRIERV